MKIMLAGSFSFADELIQKKRELEQMGHKVLTTDDLEECKNLPEIKKNFDEELKESLKYDVMRDAFNKIEEADVVLVCNYPKNGINGYLGTSVLMELGLAYHFNKKVFFLNDFDKTQGYGLEIAMISPTIIKDLKDIQ
jgi:hypothetical protein